MKLVFYFFILLIIPVSLRAQHADSLSSQKRVHSDSTVLLKSITADTASPKKQLTDSLIAKADTIKRYLPSYQLKLLQILKQNRYLNFTGKPVAMINDVKKAPSQDSRFYTMLILITILAFLRLFYTRYFNNLFRVFFNTSLRQSQLTDQLLQAKLPSLFFNIISVSSFGLFIYFLLKYFNWITGNNAIIIIIICIIAMSVIYFFKFIILKFIGWITGFREVTNRYIFIIFLINKILGILLLPFILIMAFSTPILIKAAAIVAILLTALMFLMRFYRSYGLLQHQLKFNRLHFFMYIIGIEIMPVLLIYKGLVLLLSKNL